MSAAYRLRGAFSGLAMALLLGGCASVNFDDSVAHANQELADFTQGQLALARTDAQHAARAAAAQAWLSGPLDQAGAVQLALVNSPALQAILAKNWAEAASAAQYGRMANPTLAFERATLLDEVELNRRMSFGLLDLLTWPLRYQSAQRGLERARLQLAGDVVDHVSMVRQAWVRAVAARQSLAYAQQVNALAQTSADLAGRMQAVGNFSQLDRLRHQALHAQAVAQGAAAQHEAQATQEALVRLLGLTPAQAAQLQLPSRLPDFPKSPRTPAEVSAAAQSNRLDVRLAQAEWEALSQVRTAELASTWTGLELGVRRDTIGTPGASHSRQGLEVGVQLPLLDGGEMRRDGWDAQTLAAGNRLEATRRNAASHLRESYAAYQSAHEMALQLRTQVLPLRQAISAEYLRRYNGMLLGVFDLLADAREQALTVVAAIQAEKQFWLADAALQSTLIGRPLGASVEAGIFTGSQP
jgi:outer membrane protein TolC